VPCCAERTPDLRGLSCAVVFSLSQFEKEHAMSIEDNKALVRRFVELVQSEHKVQLVDELFSPEFIDHYAGAAPPYRESAKRFFAMIFAAFPDVRATIHEQTAEQDKVWTRKTFHGTHLGPFMGVAPTGKKISVDVMDVFRIENGKIAEHWGVSDMLGLMQQIGVIPPARQ
jgi:steroid delta-isomerase-like uncharacterized protein